VQLLVGDLETSSQLRQCKTETTALRTNPRTNMAIDGFDVWAPPALGHQRIGVVCDLSIVRNSPLANGTAATFATNNGAISHS
jgi:hypothetical protein